MGLVPLRSELDKATSTLDLATRLGKLCLKHFERLREIDGIPAVAPLSEAIEGRVRSTDHALLDAPGGNGHFGHLLDAAGLVELVEDAEAHHPIEYLAFLRGMLGALRRFYDGTEDVIELAEGTPLPAATRDVTTLFRATPAHSTSDYNELLRHESFYLFDLGADSRVPILLDFSIRDRLDDLTWVGQERLPRIATIHPPLGRDGLEINFNAEWFFDVGPRSWDLDSVLDQLRSVADEAEIALLPELSLPRADALSASLAAEPTAFPPLIVAGSAHVREGEGKDEIRANESRIYLDGKQVGAHRKIHPVELKELPNGTRLPLRTPEGLTKETKPITVFSGEYTRLAVLICADLNDKRLPSKLQDAGVNLLLVPALTPETGGFNGGICGLASTCQAVSVIANADHAAFPGFRRRPFLAMAAVPRSEAGEQSREYRRRWRRCPCVGVINPNRPLNQAMKWR